MTWDEAVNQHVNMWKAKEANVPRSMTSVCTYDDFSKTKQACSATAFLSI